MAVVASEDITDRLGNVGNGLLVILGLVVLFIIGLILAAIGGWLYDGGAGSGVCFALWVLAGLAVLCGYIFDVQSMWMGGLIGAGVLLALGMWAYMFDG